MPSRATIQPSGMASPRCAVALILPIDATVVAKSITTGAPFPAGIATARGFVLSSRSVPPQGGIWLPPPTAP